MQSYRGSKGESTFRASSFRLVRSTLFLLHSADALRYSRIGPD